MDLSAHMTDARSKPRYRRILVTGSRQFADYPVLAETLEKLARENSEYFTQARRTQEWWPFDITMIVGDAKGADALAYQWGLSRRVIIERYTAQWLTHGSMAGRVRNIAMLHQGRPDVVVAFHPPDEIGKGTAHMVGIAREKRVPVIEIRGRSPCLLSK